jgi:hypothetical protein
LTEISYPNEHGYHAAIFVRGDGFSIVTEKPSQIIMFDQWVGSTPNRSHAPGTRPVRARSGSQYAPCDNANEFYVVMVP